MRMQTVERQFLAESERAALEAARAVAGRAYAPYSGFTVGAALVTETQGIFSGCNVENGSYGLTVCAERASVLAAVAGGARHFFLLAVYTPTRELTLPCGACRQVLAEFNPSLRLVLGCDSDDVGITTLDELLPWPFRYRRDG